MKTVRQEEKTSFECRRLAKKPLAKMIQVHPELELLSSQEREVFEHLMLEKTLTEIATEFNVSYSVVYVRCTSIYQKLNVSSCRQMLVTYEDIWL